MGKIKHIEKNILRNISLRTALVLFIFFFGILDILLSVLTRSWAQKQQFYIESKYQIQTDENADDMKMGEEGVLILEDANVVWHSTEDERILKIYQIIIEYSPALWSVLCLVCCALLYYQCMMKKPLALLNDAVQHIADGNLDFSISYKGKNELASTCTALEIMRSSLEENTTEMISMAEQRKRVNDAYTHEMRTPVTVLHSNADMIAEYYPNGNMSKEELLSAIEIMRHHITRIEVFIDSMNQIQKLEDLPIRRTEIKMESFLKILASSAELLCSGKNIQIDFENNVMERILFLDNSVVQQVFENQLANALSYADSFIKITCACEKGSFKITVRDDGKGFSETALKRAGQCYYSGRTSEGKYHFGLGLYISTMLCEKHGGQLEIGNAPEGGAFITASFA